MKSYREMHTWMRRILDQDNITALDRFQNRTQRPPAQSDITLSILNIFNKQHESSKGYPEPGRTVGLKITLKQKRK